MFYRFLQNEDGNFAAVLALSMFPIMGATLGAVDLTMFTKQAAAVQNALDAAALAAATHFMEGRDEAGLPKLAEDHFKAHVELDPELVASFALVRPDADSVPEWLQLHDQTISSNATYFQTSSTLSYTGLFVPERWTNAQRRAIVRVVEGEPACIIALNRTASAAVKIQGSTQVGLEGCVLASNSEASDSVYRGGSAKLAAKCVFASGGTSGLNTSATKLDCGKARENQYPSSDPLKHIDPPAAGTCRSLPGGKEKRLSPGTYCNKTISGDVTLDPGTYVLKGGQIKLNGTGSLTGTGVTIFLTEGASISIGANEKISLSPPSSGTYAGVTIYQVRGNTAALTVLGTSDSTVTGLVYAPSAHLHFGGNGSATGNGGCLRLVGDTVEMTGNSSFKIDCQAIFGTKDLKAGQILSLVR